MSSYVGLLERYVTRPIGSRRHVEYGPSQLFQSLAGANPGYSSWGPDEYADRGMSTDFRRSPRSELLGASWLTPRGRYAPLGTARGRVGGRWGRLGGSYRVSPSNDQVFSCSIRERTRRTCAEPALRTRGVAARACLVRARCGCPRCGTHGHGRRYGPHDSGAAAAHCARAPSDCRAWGGIGESRRDGQQPDDVACV
jgi:hypothetical protein